MSDDLSAPDSEHLRNEFAYIVSKLGDGPKVPYVWAGAESPETGLDCSGLVIWACTQLSTPFNIGRPTADWFWQHLDAVVEGSEVPGDLAFYGAEPVNEAHHVAVCIAGGKLASMSNGSRACQTVAYAMAHRAWLKIFDSPRYRDDLLGFRRIDFSKAKGAEP